MAAESLILFAKPPLVGRVKTRLIPVLGREGAARLYSRFLRDAAETALALRAERPGVGLICEWALEPGESLNAFPLSEWLPGPFLHRAQTGTDLGARMAAALGRHLAGGGRAALIGTDFPDLPRRVLHEAFHLLERKEEPAVALGPTSDGGYYLIGVNQPLPTLFTGIPWSTNEVLSRTIRRARAPGLGVLLLPKWRDVDHEEDLRALRDRLLGGARAPHTRNFLCRFTS